MFDLSLPFVESYFFVQWSLLVTRHWIRRGNLDTGSLKTTTQAHHQKMHGIHWGLKLFTNEDVFSSLLWVNNFFKMINVFPIFASEDSKQLHSPLICSNFLVLCRKIPQGCRGCGSRQIMRICTTASCQMPCYYLFKIKRNLPFQQPE